MLYLNGKINVIIRKLQTLNNPLMISIYQIKIKIGQDTLMLPTPYISCGSVKSSMKNQFQGMDFFTELEKVLPQSLLTNTPMVCDVFIKGEEDKRRHTK